MSKFKPIEQYGLYVLVLTIWEIGYVSYFYGKDGLYPFAIIPFWIIVLNSFASKTNYVNLYRWLFMLVSVVGTYFLAGSSAMLISIEYVLAVGFGGFLLMLNGGVDYEEER